MSLLHHCKWIISHGLRQEDGGLLAGVYCSPQGLRQTKSGRGEELNVAANLSVLGGLMPALNIAARLGRHTEKVIYVSQGRQDDSKNGF